MRRNRTRVSPPAAGRTFLLSPAFCGGERARVLCRTGAEFLLARQLQQGGAELGEVFSFLSGLYFRGKLLYARSFARALVGPAVLVITPNRGLLTPETIIDAAGLEHLASGSVDSAELSYRRPLERDARLVWQTGGEVVLLGSIATGKYLDVLLEVFGDRLCFPACFVGRGDMSRGGLLLRAARSGEELEYIPVRGAVRHGARPPRLPPLPRRQSRQAT